MILGNNNYRVYKLPYRIWVMVNQGELLDNKGFKDFYFSHAQ